MMTRWKGSASGKGRHELSVFEQVEEIINSNDPAKVRRMMHYYARRSAEWSAETFGYMSVLKYGLAEKHKPEGARFTGAQVDAVWLVEPDTTPDLPVRTEVYPDELYKVWGECRPLIRLDYKTGESWRDEKTILLYICPNSQCGGVNTVEKLRRITGQHDRDHGQEYALERCTKCGQHFHRLHVWNLD